MPDHKAAREYLSTLVRYLSSRSTKITTQQLKTALDKKFAEEGETIMATIAETLIEQGREEMRHKMEQLEQEMELEIQKVRQEMEEQLRRAHQEAQRAHQEAQAAQAEKQRGGLLSSIELGLELKFGEEGLRLFKEVQQVKETSLLSAIRAALKFVSDLGELRSLYQPALASS